MAVETELPKQHVCTLTTGWRFTLPSSVRRPRGWVSGDVLRATAVAPILYITGEGEPLPGEIGEAGLSLPPDPEAVGDIPMDVVPEITLPGDLAAASQDCYLGSGGKVVVPAGLRKLLGWTIGRRLAVTSAGNAVRVAPCCHTMQCRSCGSIESVTEVIPGLRLCSECWNKYVAEAKRRSRAAGVPASGVAKSRFPRPR